MSAPGPHVLLLSPGSKVALTRAFVDAVRQRHGILSAWEADAFSPAAPLCHIRVPGGPVEDADAARALLSWCVREKVRVVVPTRHDDLYALASVADVFAAAGVSLVVSSPEAVALCVDKSATHTWLRDAGFPVPHQTSLRELHSSPLVGVFPLVVKHARGSGSRQVRFCRDRSDLVALSDGEWIAQSVAPGVEYTVNVYVSRHGRSLCEIPHERMLTSEGEVVRARTARIPALMDLARQICEALPGARGPMNVQIFWDGATRRATVIEVNPRFGGGYPLAHEAGGRFAEWILEEYMDGPLPPRLDAWREDLVMVRYRESTFFQGEVPVSTETPDRSRP